MFKEFLEKVRAEFMDVLMFGNTVLEIDIKTTERHLNDKLSEHTERSAAAPHTSTTEIV